MDLEKIIVDINQYSTEKTHKSALEVFSILDDIKLKNFKSLAEKDWFKHYHIQIENLVYSDEKTWNTDYFKNEYRKLVSQVLSRLRKER